MNLRAQVLRYREERCFRPTAAAITLFLQKKQDKKGRIRFIAAVLLVETATAHKRGKRCGKPAWNFPKGGFDSVDDGCPVEASRRETLEETCVDLGWSDFSGVVLGPAEIPVDPPDHPALLRKGYRVGKAHYFVCYLRYVDVLPKVNPQDDDEIVGAKWVFSERSFERLIAGNSALVRRTLRKAMRYAKVPWMKQKKKKHGNGCPAM